MQSALPAAQPKRPLPLRFKVGIAATVLSLVILVFPGQMALPLGALDPLMPRMSGCANFGAPIVALFFFAFAILLSGVLLVVGIVTVIMAARGIRAGVVGAVLIDAIVASLLLIPPLTSSPNLDQGELGLFGLLAVCAVIPLAAIVLLLLPTAFRSRRLFLATVLASALLLVPGAAGVAAFGVELAGFNTTPPAASHATPQPATC